MRDLLRVIPRQQEVDSERQTARDRQRETDSERQTARDRQRKCVFRELCRCSVRCVNAQCAASVHVTATERLEGEDVCIQREELWRQRSGDAQTTAKKEIVMISCSEMRTVAPSVRHVEAAIHRCRAGQERC